MSISKVAREIFKPWLHEDGSQPITLLHLAVKVIPAKKIRTSVKICSDTDLRTAALSAYDLAVLDTIYTLHVHGYTSITPEDISRVQCGSLKRTVSSQMVAAVRESIGKMRHYSLAIDATEEMRLRRQISKDEKYVLEGPLLPLNDSEVKTANHKVVPGYLLKERPILYTYASEIHGIAKTDIALLAVGKLNATADEIPIRLYLIGRIESMKNNQNKMNSKRISYSWRDKNGRESGLYSALGYDPSKYKNWRDKRAKINRIVADILQAFVDIGYIKAFDQVKGSMICGYDITL